MSQNFLKQKKFKVLVAKKILLRDLCATKNDTRLLEWFFETLQNLLRSLFTIKTKLTCFNFLLLRSFVALYNDFSFVAPGLR